MLDCARIARHRTVHAAGCRGSDEAAANTNDDDSGATQAELSIPPAYASPPLPMYMYAEAQAHTSYLLRYAQQKSIGTRACVSMRTRSIGAVKVPTWPQ